MGCILLFCLKILVELVWGISIGIADLVEY